VLVVVEVDGRRVVDVVGRDVAGRDVVGRDVVEEFVVEEFVVEAVEGSGSVVVTSGRVVVVAAVLGVVVVGVFDPTLVDAGSGRTSMYSTSVTTKMSVITTVDRRRRGRLTRLGQRRLREPRPAA
jgi:hypothetical protein